MVGLPYDCVMNPIGAVRSTFKQSFGAAVAPDQIVDRDWGVRDLFNNFLFHQDGLSQVPILDHKTMGFIKSNTLVRFRGMIQDMHGNEFYVGAYKDGSVWRTNKFNDFPEVPLSNEMQKITWQRSLFQCVPVPGLNSWAKPSSEATIKRIIDNASQGKEKRLRPEDEAADLMDLGGTGNQLEGSPSAKKMREDRNLSGSNQPQESVSVSSTNVLPDAPKDSLTCIVKIYDAPESNFKLNEVYEFIGIFITNPENQDIDDEFEEDYFDYVPRELRVPLHLKVPQLHCIIPRKLGFDDFLPKPSLFQPQPDIIRGLRESLLGHLTDVLSGDRLAADFMLLHLLSMVHHRVGAETVGKFSLNLTGFSNENASMFRTQLRLAIKNLLPFSNCLPITVESLNAGSFSPVKNQETNSLITAPLQAVNGTHLILDETKLEPGNINAVGINNAEALKHLLEEQEVLYDYSYFKITITADIQVLVLSAGKSNICPADLVLPIRPLTQRSYDPSQEELDGWRWYLAKMRSLPYTIDAELQPMIESDLARVRRVEWNMGAQEMSRLLTMGRLICSSYGETSLTMDHWDMVINLETQRRERLH